MARKGKLREFPEEEQRRPIRIKRYAYLFLIVCEDQKTEKEYFESFQAAFPERTVYLRTVGTGLDPKGVVERAIEERTSLSIEAGKDVDVVWAVFDKDDANLQATKRGRFEDAFQIASKQNIKLAFSNEVFELWLLLLVCDVSPDKPIPRKEIYRMLEAEIRSRAEFADFIYKHGETKILSIISLIGDEEVAMQRAELLLTAHTGKPPLETNPSTRVHLLVQALREWIAYYQYP